MTAKFETPNQHQVRQLSPEEQDIFSDFDLEQRRQSKYLKFQDGEIKTLRFETKNAIIRSESRSYPGKINWDFTVYVVNDPQVDQFNPKTWSASTETTKKVIPYLKRGYTVLEIQRDGSGRDTRYLVGPIS
jgi:hypothetical protein